MLVQLNPRSDILLSDMREAYHLINIATIIWFGEWSDAGYENVATRHLADRDLKTELEVDDEELVSSEKSVEMKAKQQVIKVMIKMYHDVQKVAMDYY